MEKDEKHPLDLAGVLNKGLWQKQFDAQIEGVLASGVRPLLLLHACCAPCSAGVLDRLVDAFRVIVFYYNPNIAPHEEGERRLEELKRFLALYPVSVQNGVTLEAEDASYGEWEAAVGIKEDRRLEEEAEKGERCRRCCLMRLAKAKEKADKLGAQYFATTLTLSPHKDANAINKCGLMAQNTKNGNITFLSEGAKYLVSDFKKRNGFLKSLAVSKEYGLYRQQYCGCKCSMRNRG